MTPKLSDEAIRELCTLTTRNSSGQHFTEYAQHIDELEASGLIEIGRPIHTGTGIPYSQEHWTVQVTPEGVDVVEANPELHPVS